MLLIWWVALHGLLLCALAGIGIPLLAKWPLGAALAGHAWWRRPSGATSLLLLQTDGRWALPERGLFDLELGRRSGYTAYWVFLELVGGGRAHQLLLLKDQVDPTSWRSLQGRLATTRP